MKSQRPVRLVATMLAGLAISAQLAAQQPPAAHRHHHYKLIAVGSFGGSGGGISGPPALNQRGVLVGIADTAVPDPFAPDCFTDCFVTLGFKLHDGVVTRLLPPASGAGLSAFPDAVNEAGQIAGQAQNGAVDLMTGWPQSHAVFWQRGQTTATDLGTLGGTQSIANALNDSGQVVGAALTAKPDPFADIPVPPGYECASATFALCAMFFPGTTETHAFVWQNGVMRDLHTLGGPDSTAFAINERGEVAGWSYVNFDANASTGVPTMDPFYWSPWDGMIDLGGLGGTLGAVTWINNHGQIAGVSNPPGDLTSHPFIWSKSEGMHDLFLDNGTLGYDFGHPDWINDAGEVVGYAQTAISNNGHAFLWRNHTMTDLGTLGTDAQSEAESINSRGQIVGGTFAAFAAGGQDLRGFLWENGGPMVDLNTLIVPASSFYVTTGLIINDRGEIGCLGSDPNGAVSCLLIPCDENHPGIEDCDYSMVDSSRVAQPSTAARANDTLPASLSGRTLNHRHGGGGWHLPNN